MGYKESKKAFPAEIFPIDRGDSGMDLRDYFAAKAMQSFISSDLDTHRCLKEHEYRMTKDVVKASYHVADEMLKARES